VAARKENMMATTTTTQRDTALVSERWLRPMMGLGVWEALPARDVPYELSDPYILLHEATLRPSQMAGMDTEHPHRGFDNLWYILNGDSSTGHTTGPGGAIERADLPEGSLLFLRTGRGARHAEKIGADQLSKGLDEEVRTVLFWVNLARKDKGSEPYAIVTHSEDMAVTKEGDATHRLLVGEGTKVQLGTPGLIQDVELPHGGRTQHSVPSEFQGFAYLLDGAASFGANRARAKAGQLALMGSGETFVVEEAAPGTRYLLMAGKAYGEMPRFNGPFVD
jgi:redox-sensitive bicupin YhaK (pirin superfamily)